MAIIALLIFLTPLLANDSAFDFYQAIIAIASTAVALIAYDASKNWQREYRYRDLNTLRDIIFEHLEIFEKHKETADQAIISLNNERFYARMNRAKNVKIQFPRIFTETIEVASDLERAINHISQFSNSYRKIYQRINPTDTTRKIEEIKSSLNSELLMEGSSKKTIFHNIRSVAGNVGGNGYTFMIAFEQNNPDFDSQKHAIGYLDELTEQFKCLPNRFEHINKKMHEYIAEVDNLIIDKASSE